MHLIRKLQTGSYDISDATLNHKVPVFRSEPRQASTTTTTASHQEGHQLIMHKHQTGTCEEAQANPASLSMILADDVTAESIKSTTNEVLKLPVPELPLNGAPRWAWLQASPAESTA